MQINLNKRAHKHFGWEVTQNDDVLVVDGQIDWKIWQWQTAGSCLRDVCIPTGVARKRVWVCVLSCMFVDLREKSSKSLDAKFRAMHALACTHMQAHQASRMIKTWKLYGNDMVIWQHYSAHQRPGRETNLPQTACVHAGYGEMYGLTQLRRVRPRGKGRFVMWLGQVYRACYFATGKIPRGKLWHIYSIGFKGNESHQTVLCKAETVQFDKIS